MKPIRMFTASLILAMSLVACNGSGQETGGSSGKSGQTATLDTPVCEALTADVVAKTTGMKIYSVDDEDEPTTCTYFTDADQINRIYVQWMTEEDAIWPDRVASVKSPPPGVTVEKVSGADFGTDAALKEMLPYDDGKTSTTYLLLLQKEGVVLQVQEVTSLSDGKLRALARTVAKKL